MILKLHFHIVLGRIQTYNHLIVTQITYYHILVPNFLTILLVLKNISGPPESPLQDPCGLD
jgi:hypothetical protein